MLRIFDLPNSQIASNSPAVPGYQPVFYHSRFAGRILDEIDAIGEYAFNFERKPLFARISQPSHGFLIHVDQAQGMSLDYEYSFTHVIHQGSKYFVIADSSDGVGYGRFHTDISCVRELLAN